MTRSDHKQGRKAALAVSGALLLSAISGQAMASIYGGSKLEIRNLEITITDGDGNDQSGSAPGFFNFTVTNSAVLNGLSTPLSTASCQGLPGIPGGLNTCGADPTLDTNASNAPLSSVTRANNDFSYFGPGNDQYANSDSLIRTSELTDDLTTSTAQIAEAELQTGSTASANANIESTTALNFNFTVTSPGSTLQLTFEADPDLLAQIDQDSGFLGGSASASIAQSLNLTRANADGGGSVNWAPQGTTVNNCSVSIAGVTCVEDDDGADLNRGVSASVNPQTAEYGRTSNTGFFIFGITISDLPEADYSVALSGNTVVTMSQVYAIPAPGILSLLGLGLLSMGLSSRRRKLR